MFLTIDKRDLDFADADVFNHVRSVNFYNRHSSGAFAMAIRPMSKANRRYSRIASINNMGHFPQHVPAK